MLDFEGMVGPKQIHEGAITTMMLDVSSDQQVIACGSKVMDPTSTDHYI
jgi:hypothetical protein